MLSLGDTTALRGYTRSFMLVLPLAYATAAFASDNAAERTRLAALARQLEQVDRAAQSDADAATQDRARYHFDYARLRADLNRVSEGIQDYLVPVRAQPRDPIPISGNYTRDSGDRPASTP